MSHSSPSSPPSLDTVAVQRWQNIAPLASPWLHEEVARRMQERLPWIRLQPQAWAHWGVLRGGLQAHTELTARYPKSACFVVEDHVDKARFAINKIALPWWKPRRWWAAATHFAAPPSASVDMVWANMALHASAEPGALLKAWHQSLKVGGFLMFSCLGPDSARELRQVYAAAGWSPAGHDLTDMHDWGDMLVQTGFAEPVMDMEHITLTYANAQRLLDDMAELGRNFHPQRFASLRGRRWKAELLQRLEAGLKGADGRLHLSFEIIYGHALKAAPRHSVSSHSAIALDDMRRMLRGGHGEDAR